jgi:hypothetical protein
MKYIEPIEIMKANKDVISNNGKTIIRRESEEVPSLSTHALKHYQKFENKFRELQLPDSLLITK